MNVFRKLGLKTIINASDCYTIIGGSRMNPKVLKAMVVAAKYFVDIDLLQAKVGGKIAELTRNEAAYVTSGAAAGVVLSAAACMTAKYPDLINKLPNTTGFPKNEFIVFESQCCENAWHLIELAGGQLLKIKSSIETLKSTINKKTAGIFFFAGSIYEENTPSIVEIIKAAKGKSMPVIVDAAAYLPPVENMWYYTRDLGADLVIFSGGKFIMGPQSAGLILGKRQLIEACCKNSNPNWMIGRPFKVSKEEMIAMLTAVEIFVSDDPNTRTEKFNKTLDYIEKNICSLSGIKTIRMDTGPLGQTFPLLTIELPEGKDNVDCHNFLRSCDPAIDIGYYMSEGDPRWNPRHVFVSPINLKRDELDLVIAGIRKYFHTSTVSTLKL